jgi:hypothetical protein
MIAEADFVDKERALTRWGHANVRWRAFSPSCRVDFFKCLQLC